MRITGQGTQGRTIVYEENFWTGRKTLTIDGVPATKTNRKTFRLEHADGSATVYTIQGNFITGVKITESDSGATIVLAKNMWYDWLLIFVPFLGLGIGVLCGAIGGALCGGFCAGAAVANAALIRSRFPLAGRIPLQILVAIAANAIWFALYVAIVFAMYGGLSAGVLILF